MSSPLLGTIICIMYLDDAGFEEVKKIQNRKRIFPKCSLGDIRVRSVVLNYLILMVPRPLSKWRPIHLIYIDQN